MGTKKYYQEHKEEFKKYNEKYRKSEKGKIASVKGDKKFYEEHPGYNNKYHSKYLKTEEGKAYNQRNHTIRRAREQKIVNTLTAQEWEDILEQYNYRCFYCDVEFNCENLPTRDHRIPISKGGNNTKDNIVPACQSCNSRKGNAILV